MRRHLKRLPMPRCDSARHAAFCPTGAVDATRTTGGQAAQIDRAAGGAFSLFGARIKGRTVELVPNERIVPAWRSAGWAPGSYSIARFALLAQGAGTRLVFDHTGFPTGQAARLATGWKTNYWDPLANYLA